MNKATSMEGKKNSRAGSCLGFHRLRVDGRKPMMRATALQMLMRSRPRTRRKKQKRRKRRCLQSCSAGQVGQSEPPEVAMRSVLGRSSSDGRRSRSGSDQSPPPCSPPLPPRRSQSDVLDSEPSISSEQGQGQGREEVQGLVQEAAQEEKEPSPVSPESSASASQNRSSSRPHRPHHPLLPPPHRKLPPPQPPNPNRPSPPKNFSRNL